MYISAFIVRVLKGISYHSSGEENENSIKNITNTAYRHVQYFSFVGMWRW